MDSKFCGILTYLFPSPSPQLQGSCENNSPIIILAVKTSSLAATGTERPDLELPTSTIPRKLPLFDLFGSSMEISTHRACRYSTGLGAPLLGAEFTPGAFVGEKISNYLTLQLPQAGITIAANKKLTRNLKRRSMGKKYFEGDLKSSDIFL